LQNISKQDLEKIYYFADAIQDEPRYIQIGSKVWRNILELNKIASKDSDITIPELVMKISMMEPKVIELFFEKLNEGEFESLVEILETDNDE
jgi:HD superfamily phosphohydrolase YqeK